jgi:hypothetical protein
VECSICNVWIMEYREWERGNSVVSDEGLQCMLQCVAISNRAILKGKLITLFRQV